MNRPPRASRPFYGLLLGLLALAACSKGSESGTATEQSASATAGAAKSADDQLAEVSEYRLTMDKFDKYIAAQRNIMLKAAAMSPAERAAVEARNENKDNSNESIDAMAKTFESEPLMKDAVRQAGLSTREFALITMSLMQTGMAAGVAKMRPNDNQDSLIREMKANPANVKFLRDNEAELTRKQTALAAEAKRLGVEN